MKYRFSFIRLSIILQRRSGINEAKLRFKLHNPFRPLISLPHVHKKWNEHALTLWSHITYKTYLHASFLQRHETFVDTLITENIFRFGYQSFFFTHAQRSFMSGMVLMELKALDRATLQAPQTYLVLLAIAVCKLYDNINCE